MQQERREKDVDHSCSISLYVPAYRCLEQDTFTLYPGGKIGRNRLIFWNLGKRVSAITGELRLVFVFFPKNFPFYRERANF